MSDALTRAVRLSHVPGLALAEAARIGGVTVAALRKARKSVPVQLTRDDLVLAALTANGTRSDGPIGDLAGLASWLDYVNHDGTTADGLARDLARLAAAGRIALEGEAFRLLIPWP